MDEKDKALIDSYVISMMQTNRDLVARDRVATGKGLVAFGGIDFSIKTNQANAEKDPLD